MLSDTIGDMIARIKNAQMARHRSVEIPYSRFNHKLAEILVDEKYVASVEVIGEARPNHFLKVQLKYDRKDPIITHFKRVSKPGLRLYSAAKDLIVPLNGYGTGVISTSAGLMSVKNAKKKGIGGEIICEIW